MPVYFHQPAPLPTPLQLDTLIDMAARLARQYDERGAVYVREYLGRFDPPTIGGGPSVAEESAAERERELLRESSRVSLAFDEGLRMMEQPPPPPSWYPLAGREEEAAVIGLPVSPEAEVVEPPLAYHDTEWLLSTTDKEEALLIDYVLRDHGFRYRSVFSSISNSITSSYLSSAFYRFQLNRNGGDSCIRLSDLGETWRSKLHRLFPNSDDF